MKLNELKPKKGSIKKRKRLGRGPGSGNGTTAGKGNNGQKARSGAKIPISFEGGQMPLTRSLPKRGFRNIFKKEYQVVNVGDIDRKAAGQSTMNPEKMYEVGLVSNKRKYIKVLGNGEISVPVTVRAHSFSVSAKEKIAKADGSIEIIGKSKGVGSR